MTPVAAWVPAEAFELLALVPLPLHSAHHLGLRVTFKTLVVSFHSLLTPVHDLFLHLDESHMPNMAHGEDHMAWAPGPARGLTALLTSCSSGWGDTLTFHS